MTKKVILCLVITMFICVSYAACMDWMEEASISKDCPPDKPFHFDAYGYKCGEKPQSVHSENYKCLSCFEEKPIPIKKGHKKDFEICTNRETIKKGYDWSILKNFIRPYFLAGGINENNVERAIKLSPYCIDVSSGVETNKVKDKQKILNIVRRLKNG